MDRLTPILVIPARLGATRLPRKPLAIINGKPMIVHVWERAMASKLGPVLVATDSDDVKSAIEQAGGRARLTRGDHPSGSDRALEAVRAEDPEGAFNAVVNVQGDLPTLDPALLLPALNLLNDSSVSIGTLASVITHDAEKTAPQVVKVIGTPVGGNERHLRALYFTRAAAPAGDGPLYHHIGLYAFRRAALERFCALPAGALEQRETLEQLRALENGMRIDVAVVDAQPFGVDTPDDLARARDALKDMR